MSDQPENETSIDTALLRVREQLQDRVQNAMRIPAGGSTLLAADGDWIPFDDRIAFRILHRNENEGWQTALWRLQPGAIFPAHEHEHDEECLVLEGQMYFGEHRLDAGDFHYLQSGYRHPVARSEHGALLLIRGEIVSVPDGLSAAALKVHNYWQRKRS